MIHCCCGISLCLTVTDACTLAVVPGATVSAVYGGTTVTGTTDGSGVCCLTVPAAATWSVTASRSDYGPTTQSVVVPSGGASASVAITRAYAPLWPNSFTVSTGGQTVTVTRVGGSGSLHWQSAPTTVWGVTGWDDGNTGNTPGCYSMPVVVDVIFVGNCMRVGGTGPHYATKSCGANQPVYNTAFPYPTAATVSTDGVVTSVSPPLVTGSISSTWSYPGTSPAPAFPVWQAGAWTVSS